MKECPQCHEQTIPLKWILFNKSPLVHGRCIKCSNCGSSIRKRHFVLFGFFLGSITDLFVILFLALLLTEFVGSFFAALVSVIMLWIIAFLTTQYFSTLKVADESYCRGDMTKVEAVFALLFMAFLIGMVIYLLIIKPVILGEAVFE